MSKGEAELLGGGRLPSLVQRLEQAIGHYSRATAALKVFTHFL